MGTPLLTRFSCCLCAAYVLLGCDDSGSSSGKGADSSQPALEVDFGAVGAAQARQAVCEIGFDNPTRIGAAKEPENASNLWSVSPYLVLLPSTGIGYMTLNVDAPHFDWLLYTDEGVEVDATATPAIEFNGVVEECPDAGWVEYGAHHHEVNSWPLVFEGEPSVRIRFFATLSATDLSDPDNAGHAGHVLEDAGATPGAGGAQ